MAKEYHPDILRAHAEFGGNLDHMQSMYDAAGTQVEALQRALADAVIDLRSFAVAEQETRSKCYVELLKAKRALEDMREAFMEAIDFACDEAGIEASTFLRVWREGGTTKEADALNEWEDFRKWCAKRKAKRK